MNLEFSYFPQLWLLEWGCNGLKNVTKGLRDVKEGGISARKAGLLWGLSMKKWMFTGVWVIGSDFFQSDPNINSDPIPILHGRAEIRNFSWSVEKYFASERSERVKYFFNTRREILYLQATMLCSIYYINTNEIPNHFGLKGFLWSHNNGDIFTCEDNMLFSHVKISSFRAEAHLVFHWCLYNKIYSLNLHKL